MSSPAAVAHLLDLSDQVALVTGASRGIGRAIAELLGQAGARLALTARSPEPLAETAAALRRQHPLAGEVAETVLALPGDVADAAQVESSVAQVVATWGRLDILVNNAGLMRSGAIDGVQPAEWDRLIAANLTGCYLTCRAAAPIMQRQGSGRIVNISSITAQTGGVSGGVHYAASKGGLLAMTRTLARDLAPYGITVNAIAPGQIETDGSRLTPEARRQLTALIPLGRLGTPAEIAYAVLFLASPMAAYITGTTLDVNGGILKR